jgi:hypothetical protein
MAYQLGTRAYGSASITGAKIASDTIVNANVKSDAAIALTKLATVTASKALQSGAGGFIEASSVTTTELGYLSGVTSAIQTQINTLALGVYRRKSVIALVDPTAAPPTEVTGDRYILGFDAGTVHADWDGAAKGSIVTFGASAWTSETPAEGWRVYGDTANVDYLYIDDGSPAWQSMATASMYLADGKIFVGDATNTAVGVSMSGDVTISNAGVTTIGSTKVTNGMLAGSIAASKLDATTPGYILIGTTTSGVPTWTNVTGDVTISSAGATAIASGVIVNNDISASAAIGLSKLAAGTPGNIIVCAETTGVPTYVSMSGDVTIGYTGAMTIGATKVTNGMLAGSIEDSKLSTITTGNKVSGSAVQLASNGGLENNTGLQINVDSTNATTKLNASGELEGLKPYTQNFTLSAQNITDQYVDLSKLIYAGSLHADIAGLPTPTIGTQLTTSTEGGVTRVTFADALATAGAAALVEGDVIQFHYTSLA